MRQDQITPKTLAGAAALLAAAMLAASPGSLSAGENLPVPAGEIVLTITGGIANTTGEAVAQFDLAALEALPATTFRTTTIWTDGETEFTGVELDDLLDYVGASGSKIHAIALNDYKVDIPVSEAVDGGPIVAYLQDGAYMSRREKGPLWIVYPYDSKAEYRSEVVYSRSIWQLDRIEVVD